MEAKVSENRFSDAGERQGDWLRLLRCSWRGGDEIVVLGEPGDFDVLGVDALEGLGLEVDPTTKELRRARALAAYLSA